MGFEQYRGSTGTVTPAKGVNPFSSTFFDSGEDNISPDLLYSAGVITVTEEAWYTISISCAIQSLSPDTVAVIAPVVYRNGDLAAVGASLVVPSGTNGVPLIFAGTFSMYLDEDYTIQPGYQLLAVDGTVTLSGEPSGTQTRWSIN